MREESLKANVMIPIVFCYTHKSVSSPIVIKEASSRFLMRTDCGPQSRA